MTNREFVLWLSGYFDMVGEDAPMTRKQLMIINNHLNLAEAVEGRLGPLNTELRGFIKSGLNSVDDPADEIAPEIVQVLHDKVVTFE